MRGLRPSSVRPSRPATAEEYERAIARCENIFMSNKTRMWVLWILREAIRDEVGGVNGGS